MAQELCQRHEEFHKFVTSKTASATFIMQKFGQFVHGICVKKEEEEEVTEE
jgi:hypothetical protein